jgi:hypothetical protein
MQFTNKLKKTHNKCITKCLFITLHLPRPNDSWRITIRNSKIYHTMIQQTSSIYIVKYNACLNILLENRKTIFLGIDFAKGVCLNTLQLIII